MTQSDALKILQSGANAFVTGEPGAGKTYLMNLFTEWLRGQRKEYAVTASTGIAATHIDGMTIHSWSGIGIRKHLTAYQVAQIMGREHTARRLRNTKVLIIDEISMLDAAFINDLDFLLRKARQNQARFGGVQIVFVGDFFQLPPVSKEGAPKFAFEAAAWQQTDLQILYLTEQHRQSDQEFLEILSAMRTGQITEAHKRRLSSLAGKEDPGTFLYTHNADVDRINQEHLMQIDGEERTYEMESYGIPFLVDLLKKHVLSPETLTLRIGARVMFTKNNFEEGYVNGTIGTVVGYDREGGPVIETKEGVLHYPERTEWKIEENGVPKATVEQLPLRLAWAITVHKSQGMSLDSAEVDLSKVFEHGQGYVAISRVRSLEGLKITGMNDIVFSMHPKVIAQDRIFRKSKL